MTAKKCRRDGQGGSTLVEFAVIVTVLLFFLFGILEFAFIFYQKHYIASAAREGLRVGVRADNFNCFDGVPSEDCTETLDRKHVVETEVTNYLDALYKPADITLIRVRRVPEKSLEVEVTVNNFFPQLLSGLVPGFDRPTTLTHKAIGRYEDPAEYDKEE